MGYACFFFDVHSCNGGDTMSLVGCPARISPLGERGVKGCSGSLWVGGGVFGLPSLMSRLHGEPLSKHLQINTHPQPTLCVGPHYQYAIKPQIWGYTIYQRN